jgi:RNA polymerase sigma-70 factor (ECF subfamily)
VRLFFYAQKEVLHESKIFKSYLTAPEVTALRRFFISLPYFPQKTQIKIQEENIMKIKYEFATGEVIEIEVDEAVGDVVIELERDEYNGNRRETRRHESYSDDNDKQEILVDKSVDVMGTVEKRFEYENLNKAMEHLQPQQQELVRRIFFEGEPIVAVAKDLGITKQACNNRLNKIYNQLKKHF